MSAEILKGKLLLFLIIQSCVLLKSPFVLKRTKYQDYLPKDNKKLLLIAPHNASEQTRPNKIYLKRLTDFLLLISIEKLVSVTSLKNYFRQLSSIRVENEHNKERYESQIGETQKLKTDLDRSKDAEMSLTRKVAQLEAQVNSDASVRDSLSFREQSWQDERSELREEITSLRQEISSVKATKDDSDRRARDMIEDLKLNQANLENRIRAKSDDLGKWANHNCQFNQTYLFTQLFLKLMLNSSCLVKSAYSAIFENFNPLLTQILMLKFETITINPLKQNGQKN